MGAAPFAANILYSELKKGKKYHTWLNAATRMNHSNTYADLHTRSARTHEAIA